MFLGTRKKLYSKFSSLANFSKNDLFNSSSFKLLLLLFKSCVIVKLVLCFSLQKSMPFFLFLSLDNDCNLFSILSFEFSFKKSTFVFKLAKSKFAAFLLANFFVLPVPVSVN